MKGVVAPQYSLQGYELTFELLTALATLPGNQRDAWIDRYVLGLPYQTNTAKSWASLASVRLRELLREEVAA